MIHVPLQHGRRSLFPFSAVLLVAAATAPSVALAEASGPREFSARDLARDRPAPVEPQGDPGVRDVGPRLANTNDPRLSVLAGVAWTPGLPGGGGGSGGPWEPSVADSYQVGSIIPCLPNGSFCSVYGAGTEGGMLVGVSHLGSQGVRHCPGSEAEPPTYEEAHAVAWELGADGRVLQVHELPNTVPAGGMDHASAQGVNGAGLVVGRSFLQWAWDDCESGSATAHQTRAVTWQRHGAGEWLQADLPTGTGRREVGAAESVNAAGWIVGTLWFGPDSEGDWESAPAAWLPDPREPSGWRLERLPPPPSLHSVRALAVNDRGLILGNGYLERSDGHDVRRPVTWQRTRFGTWHAEVLLTLGGDTAWGVHLTDTGDVIGSSTTGVMESGQGNDPDVEQEHAAIWAYRSAAGVWLPPQSLGTVEGPRSNANAGGPASLAVGRSNVDARNRNEHRAVIWEDGVPTQLDARTEGRWTLEYATELLPGGQIVAKGYEGNQGSPTVQVILEPLLTP